MRQSHKTVLIWVILILMFVSIWSMFSDSGSKTSEEDVTQFKQEIADKSKAAEIESVRIEPGQRNDARYVITYRAKNQKTVVYGEMSNTITDAMTAAGISYKVKPPEESSIWPQILLSWLPMLLLFAIFFFFMRQLQA